MVSGHPSNPFPGDPKNLPVQDMPTPLHRLLVVPSLFLANIHTLVDAHMGSCPCTDQKRSLYCPILVSRHKLVLMLIKAGGHPGGIQCAAWVSCVVVASVCFSANKAWAFCPVKDKCLSWLPPRYRCLGEFASCQTSGVHVLSDYLPSWQG